MLQDIHPVTVPMSVMRDLRCGHCQSFVSCGPVYVVPERGVLCGRCSALAKRLYRNRCYETLAAGFLFPCTNWERHCSKRLKWNASLEHEHDCTYRSACNLFFNHPAALCRNPRKFPEKQDVQLQHVSDSMIENLECMTCQCYLSCDPVFINMDGNCVCHRCVHSNGIPQGFTRNLAYEMLAHVMIFPCIYKNRGCTMRMSFGKELWRHEADCSYGQIHQRLTSKKNRTTEKERGVIMTHSGHYYGTITPNVALWAPPEFDKRDQNDVVKKEYIDAVLKKEFRDEHDLNRNSVQQNKDNSKQSSNGETGRPYQSSSGEGPRAPSVSSAITNRTSNGVSPRMSNSQTGFPILNEVSGINFQDTNNNIEKMDYFSQTSVASSKSDMMRPSLGFLPPAHIYNNLNYSASFTMQPSTDSDLVKPKRGDSFKMGNKIMIDELKIRQKLKVNQIKHKKMDASSVESDETSSLKADAQLIRSY